MSPRHGILGLILLATLVAAFWPQPEEEGLVEPMARATRPATAQPAVDVVAGGQRMDEQPIADLFPAQTWQRPMPVVAPQTEVPPAPPVAPPLPYVYVGRWKEKGHDALYLSRDGQLVEARTGDVLDGLWRVDRITTEQVVFIYLPLHEEKTLRLRP